MVTFWKTLGKRTRISSGVRCSNDNPLRFSKGQTLAKIMVAMKREQIGSA
jgi:hypothetical protein